MRGILFRGKRLDNGEWVYGNLICSKNYAIGSQKFPLERPIVVGGDTVGQYIGLEDANGNKIFENDIVSFTCTRWKDDKCDDVEEYTDYAVVKYGEFNCSCCSGVYGWYFDNGDIRLVSQCAVAGNVYDNPELLPKEEHFGIQEPQLSEAEQTVLAETYMKAFVEAGKKYGNG